MQKIDECKTVRTEDGELIFKLFVRNISAEFPRSEIWDSGKHARYGWGRGGGDSLTNSSNTNHSSNSDSKYMKTKEIVSRFKARKEGEDAYMFYDPSTMGVFIGNGRALHAIESLKKNEFSKRELNHITSVLSRYYHY